MYAYRSRWETHTTACGRQRERDDTFAKSLDDTFGRKTSSVQQPQERLSQSNREVYTILSTSHVNVWTPHNIINVVYSNHGVNRSTLNLPSTLFIALPSEIAVIVAVLYNNTIYQYYAWYTNHDKTPL
jgi:hypothetical protein